MKLVTFSGQGTPIAIPVLMKVVEGRHVKVPRDLLQYVYRNPSSPGSIAVCSGLFYQLFQEKNEGDQLLLGHSLGELSCLAANGLFGLEDLFSIAKYRNDLMVQCTKRYLTARGISERFALWALSSPRAQDLPQEVAGLLQDLQINSVSIANANSVKQCVVSGLESELASLRIELQMNFPRLRITELSNPHGIPFHNSAVLSSTQEPLYDYIWQIMKKNNTHVQIQLDSPILCNLDGQVSTVVHRALEKFVRCSSNTVQFTWCYDTINEMASELDEAVCMGPGNVIYNLVKRNCNLEAWEYDSLESIESYERR